jgi:hypothetical protein
MRIKNTKWPKLSMIGACALGGVALSGSAYANHPVTIFFDGAWCQTTAGGGPDTVWVAANATVYPPNGFFDPNDPRTSHTVTVPLGVYNDRGGSAHQEMKKTALLGFVLAPGQGADAVVAMYGHSNGGFLQHLVNAFKTIAPTVGAAILTAYGSPAVGAVVKAEGGKTIDAVSQAFKSADPGTYVGDIKIHVEDDSNDNVSFTMAPNTNAKDKHVVNPPLKSESFQLNGQRAEYWPKLIVLVH